MSLRIGIGLGLIPIAARPAATTAPVNVDKPFFAGILTQGQSADVNPGSWIGLPSANFTYAIKRGATTVSTDPEYVWTSADVAAGAGAITVAVTATNDIGPTTATSDPVTIAPPLALSGSPISAPVGAPYTFTPSRTGGHAPFVFVLTGTLPAGLEFSTSTGTIAGTPVASGTANLSITVEDADGLTKILGPFVLEVTSASTWTPADLAGGYWYDFDADDVASQVIAAEKITAWNSKVGDAGFTAAGGVTKTAAGLGDKAVATFGTVALVGNAAANAITKNSHGIAKTILARCTSGGGGGIMAFSTNSASGSRFQVSWGALAAGANSIVVSHRRSNGDALASATSSVTIPTGTWALITVIYDPLTAAIRFRINGLAAGGGAMAAGSATTANTSSAASRFGGALTGALMTGQVAQVLGSTLIDDDTVQRIEGYVAHRWGVQATVLDASHPWAITHPTSAPTNRITLTRPFGGWGASNFSGGQDGTGVTMESVMAPRFTNPQQILGGTTMMGASGNTSQQVLARVVAATAAEKAGVQIVQVGGLNDFGGGSATVGSAFTTWQDIVAAFGHSDVLSWTSFFATGPAGTSDWCERVDWYRRCAAAAPGKMLPNWAYCSDPAIFPPITPQDLDDQARMMLASSYRHDSAHANAPGYTIQSDSVLYHTLLGLLPGAGPWFPWCEVYSQEATNQTNGGFVGNLPFFGSLDGASVAFEASDPDFAIAIVGADIKISRASATVLLDGYYDRKVRITKGNYVHIDTVRILLGTPSAATANYRVEHNGLARYGQWEGFDVSSGPKWSAVIDLEMLDAAQDNTQLFILRQLAIQGLEIYRATSGALEVRLRDASGTLVASWTGGTLRAASGRKALFVGLDASAGVGSCYLGDAPAAVNTAPGAGAATTMNIAGPHLRLSGIEAVGSNTVPKCLAGIWWEAADYIDFSQAANRALFWTAGAPVVLPATGAVVIAAGAGAGNTVTPYWYQHGNAADRYMARNDGNGTTGTGATKKGVNIHVFNPGARLTTLAA